MDEERYFKIAVNAMLEARREIESQIKRDPFFLTTLEPYECEGKIVGRMCKASKLANSGPMAAVAGIIAQHAIERAVEEGASFAVVDNGGDIAIFTDRKLLIGTYAGKSKVRVGFVIEPSDEIFAVCTSSGTVGHSISFGFADAATIFANDACIADAFATVLANEIKENFERKEIKETLESLWKRAKNHIRGAMVIKGDFVGFIGNIPEIVRTKIKPDLITRG